MVLVILLWQPLSLPYNYFGVSITKAAKHMCKGTDYPAKLRFSWHGSYFIKYFRYSLSAAFIDIDNDVTVIELD